MDVKEIIRSHGREIAIGLILVAALVVALLVVTSRPYTDDASIDADVVHVAAAVGGRIIRLPVRENMSVHRGDLLFQIDPVPYRLTLQQAKANLDVARASLDTQRRFIATQRSNAVVAGEQTSTARSNYGLAARTTGRLSPLTDEGYVPRQQLDQARIAELDAATALKQSRAVATAAQEAINTDEGPLAAVRAAVAAVALAQRGLDDTTVRAPHDGVVVGLTISTGEVVTPTQSIFTLINTEEWFAVANFRETDLGRIAIGDCATVFSLVDQNRPIKGYVEGVGWGVLSEDRINLPRSAPYVEPKLNWVRVAQRFPVRVRLENPPPQLARLGASAIVEIRHGAACR